MKSALRDAFLGNAGLSLCIGPRRAESAASRLWRAQGARRRPTSVRARPCAAVPPLRVSPIRRLGADRCVHRLVMHTRGVITWNGASSITGSSSTAAGTAGCGSRLRSARAGSRFPRTHRSTSAPHVGDDAAAVAGTAGAPSPPSAPSAFRSASSSPTRSIGDTVVRVAPTNAGDLAAASGASSPPARTRSCARLATSRCFCAMRIARRSSSARKVALRWSIRAGGERTPGSRERPPARRPMTGEDPASFSAYIGPHILGDEYEVSPEVVQMFSLQFDNINPYGARLLDMSRAICQSLEEAGVPRCEIHDPRLSTTRLNERFFLLPKGKRNCGRHAAVAMLR